MEIRKFYIANTTGTILCISFLDKSVELIPIIWRHQGLYGIVSVEKMKNIIQLIQDNAKLPILNRKIVNEIYWDETERIDSKIGKLLFNT